MIITPPRTICPKVVGIFGPTAVGKSALAIQLAKAIGAEIINADSRQVFQAMPLLTACPSAADYATVPHHLFEFLPPTETFSAGHYATLAHTTIAAVHARGRHAIVVGGTGFYFRALLHGLGTIPPIPPAVTQQAQTDVETNRKKAWQEIQHTDPTWATTADPHNTQRLVRALAVTRHTGQPFSTQQQSSTQRPALRIGLLPTDENTWRTHLTTRWQSAVTNGLLQEVTHLTTLSIPTTAKSLESLTLPLWQQVLHGHLTTTQAITQAATLDAQYAKRQRTWLRNQFHPHLTLTGPNIAPILDHLSSSTRCA